MDGLDRMILCLLGCLCIIGWVCLAGGLLGGMCSQLWKARKQREGEEGRGSRGNQSILESGLGLLMDMALQFTPSCCSHLLSSPAQLAGALCSGGSISLLLLRQHSGFACLSSEKILSDGEGRPVRVSIRCTCQAWGSSWVLRDPCSSIFNTCSCRAEKQCPQDPFQRYEDMLCADNFVFFFIYTCSCVWLRLHLSWKINTWILNNNNYCFWLFWIHWQRPLQNNCTDQSHGGAEEDPWVGVWWEH